MRRFAARTWGNGELNAPRCCAATAGHSAVTSWIRGKRRRRPQTQPRLQRARGLNENSNAERSNFVKRYSRNDACRVLQAIGWLFAVLGVRPIALPHVRRSARSLDTVLIPHVGCCTATLIPDSRLRTPHFVLGTRSKSGCARCWRTWRPERPQRSLSWRFVIIPPSREALRPSVSRQLVDAPARNGASSPVTSW